MKLHATKFSTTSRPVMMFIAENKIDCEMVDVDLMTGEHVKEPFISLNPSKQVPVLEDDGMVLTESSTILKYLADKINSPAYPKGLKERAKVHEMMDWLNTGCYRELGYHLVYPQIFPHHVRQPEPANKGTVEWGKAQSENWLSILDKHWLGKGNAYLCGNEMTIADYFGADLVGFSEVTGNSFKSYPNVEKWLGRMKALPSWNSVHDVIDGFAASLKDKEFVRIS